MSCGKSSTKSGTGFKQSMVNQEPSYERKRKRRKKRKGMNPLYE